MSRERFEKMINVNEKEWNVSGNLYESKKNELGHFSRYIYIESVSNLLSDKLNEEVIYYFHQDLDSFGGTFDLNVHLRTIKSEVFYLHFINENDIQIRMMTRDKTPGEVRVEDKIRRKKIAEAYYEFLAESKGYRLPVLTGVTKISIMI